MKLPPTIFLITIEQLYQKKECLKRAFVFFALKSCQINGDYKNLYLFEILILPNLFKKN